MLFILLSTKIAYGLKNETKMELITQGKISDSQWKFQNVLGPNFLSIWLELDKQRESK